LKETILLVFFGFCLCFADEISDTFVIDPKDLVKIEEVYEMMNRRREARLAEREDLVLAGVAFLRETSLVGSLIIGILDFYQNTNASVTYLDTFVYAQNEFLLSGSYYGIHIHTYGDLSSTDGDAIGGHFIGRGAPVHGCPPNPIRHEGDMGNFLCTTEGIISEWKELDLLQTYSSNNDIRSSIIGRSAALHGIQDQCDASYLGPKIAVGTVGISLDAPDAIGLDFEPTALVARVTGTSFCFICQASVWIWRDVDTTVGNPLIRIRARAYSPYDPSVGWNHSSHGWVINQFGDISAKNGMAVGGHFDNNQNIHFHDLPPSPNRHAGDLGNSFYVLPYNGGPYVQTWLDLAIDGSIFDFQDVAGRGISYHASYDRGNNCQTSGGSGAPWGMGVLGIANPTVNIPKIPKAAMLVLDSTFDKDNCLPATSNDVSSASAVGIPLGLVTLAVMFRALF
jgi:Cu/Zn superoxide dismutase